MVILNSLCGNDLDLRYNSCILAGNQGTDNWEEEMAAMKAMLKKLVKENEEKEACIRLPEEKIEA